MWQRQSYTINPDFAPCGVVMFADDGSLLAVNDTLIRMLDLDRETLGERHIDDLLAPAARVLHQMVLNPMLKLQGRADEVQLILRKRDGTDIHVLVCGTRRVEPGGAVNQCSLMPINERKKLEGQLIQTQRAAHDVPGAIFQLEMDDSGAGRFAYVSEGVEQLVEGASVAMLRSDAAPFFQALHPEDRQRCLDDMRSAGRQGGGGHYQFRVLKPSRAGVIWCESHATSRLLPDGKVIWSGYIADITHQKATEEKLRENDKLRLTAMLAAGIAHDFNNVLGSINGLAELCLMEASGGSRQERNLKRIMESGLRAARLVRQMLDYSRQSARSVRPIAMGAFVERFEPLLAVSLPAPVRLLIRVERDGVVEGDEVQLEQVLLNLINNAGYAMRDSGGVVTVTVGVARAPFGKSSAEEMMRITVVDDGCGIHPDDLANIYQPFFTTKPVGEGTGLGLSAVHGIVKAHGGSMEVESTAGKGTAFTVWLPTLPEGHAQADVASGSGRAAA